MTDQAVPFYHAPIMAGEVLSLLEPSRGGIFVDGTLGGGGHAQADHGTARDHAGRTQETATGQMHHLHGVSS